jgi:hypothetical protein
MDVAWPANIEIAPKIMIAKAEIIRIVSGRLTIDEAQSLKSRLDQ